MEEANISALLKTLYVKAGLIIKGKIERKKKLHKVISDFKSFKFKEYHDSFRILFNVLL